MVGGLVAEAVNHLIPNQKLDRVIDFLKTLEQNLSILNYKLDTLESNLANELGLDLFEDGIVQASRTITKDRRNKLANLLTKSLTQEEIKYNESKQLLNILRELTDPELLWLAYYAKPLDVVDSDDYHKQLIEQHPEVLEPARYTIGVGREEYDRGALQNSYINSLVRLGLLKQKSNAQLVRLGILKSNKGPDELTALGRLLLRYIEKQEKISEENISDRA